MKTKSILFLTLNLFLSEFVFADSENFSFTAIPVNGEIQIDGMLDEEFWSVGFINNHFTQREPDSGEQSEFQTNIKIGFDDNYLYVVAQLLDSEPEKIVGQLYRRDNAGYSDWFEVIIDSYHDQRTAFGFQVNPKGVRVDQLYYDNNNEDSSWDAVWDASSAIGQKGWTTEIRIPFSQLRFDDKKDSHVWGIQFFRKIARTGERSFWAPILAETQGFVSEFGELTGVQTKSNPKRLEILPYSSGSVFQTDGDENDPYYNPNDLDGNLGIDFKYGLGSNFTLTGTINPDFGQVEADPAVINLSAYETYFQEKRPFFLEGMDIFSYGKTKTWESSAPIIFYSRRIGRQPRGSISNDAIYSEIPGETTILGALKLSGKTANGWSIGVLDAFTEEELATYVDSSNNEYTQPVEPRSNTLIARVKKDLHNGKTIFGGFLGYNDQQLTTDDFKSQLNDHTIVEGMDFEHRIGESDWIASGVITFSQINGSKEVITQAQRAYSRYYQRPDQNYLHVDSNATSLEGHALEISISKLSGKHWLAGFTYGETSPGFENNDIGFLNSADYRSLMSGLVYQENQPGKLFQRWLAFSGNIINWNFGNEQGFNGMFFGLEMTTNSLWSVNINGNRNFGGTNFNLLRGGPSSYTPKDLNFRVNVNGDRRKKLSPSLGFGYRNNESGEYDKWVYIEATYRVNTVFQIEAEYSISKQKDLDQYITEFEDGSAVTTYGKRYVFGDYLIDSHEWSFGLDWTYSPDLSFQFFVKPFILSYDFIAFKEFTTPGEFAFEYYNGDEGTLNYSDNYYSVDIDGDGPAIGTGFENPDFNFRSMRLNAVVRWEFLPGSTLYFVWQQNRDNYVAYLNNLDLERDVKGLFKIQPDNTFLIKASYWLGY